MQYFRYIKDYIKSNNLDSDQKVLVVSHYHMLRLWTADINFDMELDHGVLAVQNYMQFYNCDMYFDKNFDTE